MSNQTEEVFTIKEKIRGREIPCITKDGGDKLKFMSNHTVKYLSYTDAVSIIAMNIAQDNIEESYLMWISTESGFIDNGDTTLQYYPFDLIFTKTTNAGISFTSDRVCNIVNQNTMKCVLDNDTGILTFFYDIVNHEGEGTIYEFGDKRTWAVDSSGEPEEKNVTITKVVFDESFKNARPRYCNQWFSGLSELANVEGTEYLDTSECISMESMFRGCTNLLNLNVSKFDINKVKTFNNMFNGCSILTRVYSLNTEYWNGDNATSDNMFTGCLKINDRYKASKITKKYAYIGEDDSYFVKSPVEV